MLIWRTVFTAITLWITGSAMAQEPAAPARPVFGFVGLHGGVFSAIEEQARDLPVQVEYLDDAQLSRRQVDVGRYRLIFVMNIREEAGSALAELVLAARPTHPDLRVFALSGGGSGATARVRQLSEKQAHKDLLERDAELQAYYGSSAENMRRLLVCALVRHCGAALTVEPPLPPPSIGIYHPDAGGPIDLEAFERFLRDRGEDCAKRPRVAVIAHDIHMQMQQPAVVEALIRGLERRGITACGVLDSGEGLQRFRDQYEQLVKDLHPEVAIHTCHSVDTADFREQLDIPHVHSIFLRKQSAAEWAQHPKGLDAHEIAFQIATQETLGAIEPQIGAATLHGGGSDEAMQPIEERIDHLVRRTVALVKLRRTPNAEKRVAVLYWNSGLDKRGLARGTATGMFLNAPQSLVTVLQRLQHEGYGVTNAPTDEDQLLAAMTKGGRQYLPNDMAGIDELVHEGEPALVSVTKFKSWLEKRVPLAARQKLAERWGPPPGRFMVWRDEHGEEFLVVPRLVYGNVVLLPQALRGEANDSAAIHDKLSAPPYNYLATYFWLQEEWNANAMVHFGTHGSEIALPGRSTGLGPEDWTDICIGDLPNVQPWIVENLGEAPAAKRRSYGVLIGHLPPPVENAGLSGDLQNLHDDLEKCLGLEESALKERFRAQVSDQARKLELDRDLGLTFAPSGPLAQELLERIDAHLHRLLEEPIPTALHRLGEVPADDVLIPHLVTCLHKAFLDRLADILPGEASGGHDEHLRGKAEALLRAVLVDKRDDDAALASIDARLPADGVPKRLAEDLATARQMHAGYQQSDNELIGILEALSGRFVSPGPGRGPDRNPAVLPTGRNIYLLNQDEVPSKASWELGSKLADELLDEWRKEHGRLPQKIALSLNAGATFQDYGVMESQILRLLGVEPIWNERNLVKDVRVLSRAELGRPRVDVMISSGARYYASLPSRMELLDVVLRRIQELDEPDNGVRLGTATMLAELRERGIPFDDAQRLASARIFGAGSGAGVGGQAAKFSYLVERSADWDTRRELMEEYMSRAHSAFVGGAFVEAPRAAYESALRGTEVVLRTWARSTESPLSNRYQWLQGGALAAAVEFVSGKRPEFRLVDVRDPDRARNVDATLALRSDFRARLLNRKWIEGMQREGYAGADQVAVHVGNAFGWETMQAGAVTTELWNEIKQVYLDDSLKLGTKSWFDRENPWAQQAIASTLLDAARKGFWAADAKTLAEVANFYVESKREHGSGAGLRDAGSGKLQAFAEKVLGVPQTPIAAAAAPALAPALAPSNADANSVPAIAAAAKPADRVPSASDVRIPAPTREVVQGQRLQPVAPAAPAPRSRLPEGIGAAVVVCLAIGLLRKPRI